MTTTKNNFCASKVIVNKEKIQPTKWGKLFVNYISNKELISIIKNSDISTTNNSVEKWVKDCIDIFHQIYTYGT
jgi:hypothetical protein